MTPFSLNSRLSRVLPIVLPLLAAGVASAPVMGAEQGVVAAADSPWKVRGSLTLRESYDTNLFLQDLTPAPTVAYAVQPRQASLVTATGASASFEGHLRPALNVTMNYSAEAVFYDAAASENYATHKLGLTAGGTTGETTWTVQSTTTRIAGGDEGPSFGCAGGATALGGIPLRDRRSALIERSRFKLTHPVGAWFVRPMAGVYVHDFLTRQSARAGYLNYIDRRELIAGCEVGRALGAKTRLVAGFHAGRQDQFKLHGIDSPYDSRLRRWVVGVEGTPWPWLQVNLLAGPETRRYGPGTPAGFDRDRVLLWIDGEAVVAVTSGDTCVLTVRRFEQPAFTSQSMYEDITYEVSWRRKLGARLTLAGGFKAYGGDWPGPATREDWIFTPSAALRFAPSRHWNVELTYLAESAESRIPATPGREYRRQVGSISTGFIF